MKYLLILPLLLLTACAGISDKITDGTGTTLEQRCQNYRSLVAAAKIMPPSPERTQRIALYEVFLANCP